MVLPRSLIKEFEKGNKLEKKKESPGERRLGSKTSPSSVREPSGVYAERVVLPRSLKRDIEKYGKPEKKKDGSERKTKTSKDKRQEKLKSVDSGGLPQKDLLQQEMIKRALAARKEQEKREGREKKEAKKLKHSSTAAHRAFFGPRKKKKVGRVGSSVSLPMKVTHTVSPRDLPSVTEIM